MRPDWQDEAACLGLDPDLFFPVRGSNATETKKVCRRCPVREACLHYAMANHVNFGVWGGLTERERRRLRRARLRRVMS